MQIGYVVAKRKISVGANPGDKYLAVISREKTVDFDTIADQIAESSSMSKGDVMAVLQQLEQQMSIHLMRGASVRLGMLGIFQPAIKAMAVSEKELVTADTIKKMNINFRPSPWLRKKMSEFKKVLVKLEVKGYVGEEGEEEVPAP